MSNTANINVANNVEEFWYNDTKPYMIGACVAGLGLALAAFFRLGIWAMLHFSEYTNAWVVTSVATLLILLVAGVSIYVAGRLYGVREFANSELLLQKQAVISGLVIAGFYVFAMWENFGEWMFGPLTLVYFVMASIGIAATWFIRRWSDKRKAKMPVEVEIKTSFWQDAGLGSTSEVDVHAVPGGYRHKIKLDPKVTTDDIVGKITLVAKNYNTNVKKVRISESAEDANYAFITVLNEEPFRDAVSWVGPDKPGTSIGESIEFATYDIGNRAEIYLAGKDGASCYHWLTVGTTGSGKTFGWQVIYGSVLARKDVSLVYIDPAKGVASAMPLASGIEWFANGIEESVDVIDGMIRAIKARGNELTRRGYQYWKPGCGLNFVIFHVEEAAIFMSKDKSILEKLVEIALTARSAGIAVVYSLQRATHENLPVTLREMTEGRITFKIGNKKDNPIALKGIAIEKGAAPHLISVKGGFYMTSTDTPEDLAGNVLRTDFIIERDLERSVDMSAQYRTPLDNVTASAFGSAYTRYRNEVADGRSEWQITRVARDSREQDQEDPQEASFKAPESHAEAPTEEFNTETPKSNKASNLNSDKQSFIDALWNMVQDYSETISPEFTKKDILDMYSLELGKGQSWIYARLKEFVEEGRLEENNKILRIK